MGKQIELVTWRGTYGVGDFMMALNSCYRYSHEQRKLVNLEMHWEHGRDHIHHFEDPETIVERLDFIKNFYRNSGNIKVYHKFYSNKYYSPPEKKNEKYKRRFDFESGYYNDKDGPNPNNNWLFDNRAFLPIRKNKIVVWRPTFNAEPPRGWKRRLSNDQWNIIIKTLESKGFKVKELCYRTPISESLFHISECELVICYDGMWHYIAKNLAKPMVVISEEKITKYHTGYALMTSHNKNIQDNIWFWLNNINKLFYITKAKAKEYYDQYR